MLLVRKSWLKSTDPIWPYIRAIKVKKIYLLINSEIKKKNNYENMVAGDKISYL